MLDKLFLPVKIGKLKIKNALAVSSMVCNYCTDDGMATERYIAYHEEKAKGGWGLIMTENYAVAPEGRGFSNMACMYNDEQMKSHAELTKRVHQYGAKIIAQMVHGGRQTNSTVNKGFQPVAPTSIPCPANQEMPHELTIPEIKELVSKFGDAAKRFYQAGFDGVEIHGGHGYLIAQFMSPYANKRVDEYGGVLYNRLRFAREVIEDIKKKTSPDFPIVFRISSEEYMPGGRTIQDTVSIALMLEEWGVNAIDITAGTYGEDSTIPTMASPHAWNIASSAEVKKAVNIPVMVVGRIIDPILAETVLKSGKADIILMGRGSLADPDLPEKAKAGQFDRIRQCIGCLQGCIGRLGTGPIGCLVNPQLGYEFEKVTKTQEPKKVWVVGAGPAGIEAARAAAMKGHHVTLFEMKDRLGGAFTLAAYTPYKGEIASYVSWAKRELDVLGVDTKLNTLFKSDMVKEGRPDTVIVTTGSKPYVPESINIKGSKTIEAKDLLSGQCIDIGKKCAVLGGGLIGLETAVHLGWLGRDVTIIEMLDKIAADVEGGILPSLLKLVEKYGIKVLTKSKVSKIEEGKVTIDKDGKTETLDFDMVVLALGVKSENRIAEELKSAGASVIVAGDARVPKKALEATRDGFMAGLSIK